MIPTFAKGSFQHSISGDPRRELPCHVLSTSVFCSVNLKICWGGGRGYEAHDSAVMSSSP